MWKDIAMQPSRIYGPYTLIGLVPLHVIGTGNTFLYRWVILHVKIGSKSINLFESRGKICIWIWFFKKIFNMDLLFWGLGGCLVGKFKHTFEHFKQHYTHFYTLFHLNVYQKHSNNIIQTLLPKSAPTSAILPFWMSFCQTKNQLSSPFL